MRDFEAYARYLPAVHLSRRAAGELQLLATGALSPLDRFMGAADYRRVLAEMRLTSGQVFPIPIVLTVEPDESIHLDKDIALRSANNELLALMTIEEIYPCEPDDFSGRLSNKREPTNQHKTALRSPGNLNILS